MNDFYRKKSTMIAAFVKNKVFYITLSLSLIVLLAATFIIFGLLKQDSNPTQPINIIENNDSYNGQTPEWENNESVNISDDTQANTPVTDQKDDKNNEETEPKVSDEETSVYYQAPASCSIGQEYSGSIPVFSETLQDWRLHQGVDYCSDDPVAVFAAADGMIEDVYTDGLMGQSVVILHKDGVRTLYQSLAEDVNVTKGEEVPSGDKIGYSGTSASAETVTGCHLHFAVIKDGKYCDPAEFIE